MGCRKETIVQPKDYPYVITKNVTNIDSTGATLEANILDFGKDEITDFGFRLRNNGTDYNFSLKNKRNLDDFKIRISTDIVQDITYTCRAYIKTNKNLVLGNEMSFVAQGSKSPIIEDFNPKKGFLGTRVTLTGKYFSQSGNAKVYINKVLATVIYSSEDTIVFITPAINYIGDAFISIKTGSQESFSNSKFRIQGQKIESVSPLSGHPGDSVLIKGEGFFQNGNNISILFGTYKAPIISTSDTLIKVKVPNTYLLSDISVSIRLNCNFKTTIFTKYLFSILKP